MEPTVMTENGSLRNPYHSTTVSTRDGVIVCEQGPHQGLEVPLSSELLHIGRDEWCDISLPLDKKVSRHHGELKVTDDGISLRDLSSSNGTFVDNTRVFDAPLLPDSTFQVGQSQFRIRWKGENKTIKVDYHDGSGFLVGKSPAMRKIFSMLSRLGPSDTGVLLQGETGTGKTSIARALHQVSHRSGQPFVHVNCGALSPNLIESELFGYEKGAFTGAQNQHRGYFEQAHGGTLFLDEIGELPLDLQPKLLDVIERQRLRRLGAEKEIQVDFRLVTATHRNLRQAAQAKEFREDLYYRIAVTSLTVPALRERNEDIPLLAEHILSQIRPTENYTLTPAAEQKMQSMLWPGNVRQMRNILESSLIFLEGLVLDADDLVIPDYLLPDESTRSSTEATSHSGGMSATSTSGTLQDLLGQEEKRIIEALLEELDWDIPAVYERLDISRSGLYHRMKKHNIKRND